MSETGFFFLVVGEKKSDCGVGSIKKEDGIYYTRSIQSATLPYARKLYAHLQKLGHVNLRIEKYSLKLVEVIR